jgi:hypothetical protein
VITAYRLSSSRYPPNSGKGAAIRGGRWNAPGMEVIYLAASRPLAVLEILVHYSVLPKDFVMTPVRIPDHLEAAMEEISLAQLPPNWNAPKPRFILKIWERRGFAAAVPLSSRSLQLSFPRNRITCSISHTRVSARLNSCHRWPSCSIPVSSNCLCRSSAGPAAP